MSEHTYSADAPGTAADAARKRQLIVLAIVVAIAAVAAIVYFGFIKGGGKGADASLPPIPPRHSATHATSSPTPSTDGAGVVPAVYQPPPANNPFKPLVIPPTTSAATGAPAPTSTPTPSVVAPPSSTLPQPIVTVTVTATPTSSSRATATPTASQSSPPIAGQPIKLTLDAVDPTAGTVDVTLQVGSSTTQYKGEKPGQVFGDYFKVVAILSSDPSQPPVVYGADFQYGDQFVQLAQGEWAQLG